MSNKGESYFIDQIDAYLDGKLNQMDKQLFDKAIIEDASLKDKIESHIISRSVIRQSGEQELKSKFLKNLRKEQHLSTEKKRSPLPILLFMLAFAVLFLLAMIIYNRSVDDSSVAVEPIALADVEDPSYTLLRSQGDTTIAITWSDAIQAFVRKDYDTSLLLLDSMDNNAEFNSKHLGKYALMKGVSYLKTGDYKNAENSFAEVTADNPYYDQAEWYMALTSYYSSDIPVAKRRLNTISKDPQHYKNEAASNYLKLME